MELDEWMKQNRWDCASLSRELGVARLTIRDAMRRKREISARLALKIQDISNGKVKIRDLLPPLEE
jgi:plasmid maintenance system antidote protein VapI